MWDEIYQGSDEDIANLIQRVKNETKATRKKREDRSFLDEVDDFGVEHDQDDTYQPPKKRKISRGFTSSKQHTPSKLLTPSRKRYEYAELM